METLGAFIRDRRVKTLKLSLRAFCKENDQDCGNWSRIERDMRNPPKIQELTELLKIESQSPEYNKLQELIATQAIKESLTEVEVEKRLPIALRAVNLLSEEELKKLKEKIKGA